MRRILFITSTRIGDAVISTGVLKALVDQNPDATFTIVCGPLAAPLFAAVPRLDRVIPFRKRRFDLHWFDLWRDVRGTTWDTVIDIRNSFLGFFLKARVRRVVGRMDQRPRVVSLPSVIGHAGPLDPHVYVDARHRDLAARIVPDGAPVLALAPVASLPEKTWPPQRFAALMRLLLGSGGPCEGWRVAAFGGPGDEASAEQVLAAVPAERRIKLVAEPDLLTVHASLARCRAFVGNDSGLSHLASAAGLPALSLFGATDAERYAPWGGMAVRAPGGDLAALAPEAVAEAFKSLLARGFERQRG